MRSITEALRHVGQLQGWVRGRRCWAGGSVGRGGSSSGSHMVPCSPERLASEIILKILIIHQPQRGKKKIKRRKTRI